MFTTDHGRAHAAADLLHTLGETHRHSESLLGQLATAVEAAGGHELTEAQRNALELRLQAFAHHPLRCTEEETSLFALMRNQAGLEIQRVCRKLDALEEYFWVSQFYTERAVRITRDWLEHSSLTRSEYAVLSNALSSLRQLHHKLIEIEENEVIPAAEQVLNEAPITAA